MLNKTYIIDRIINMPNSNWCLKEITPSGRVDVLKYSAPTKREVKEMIFIDGIKQVNNRNIYVGQ
jgi:hypothetical protein